MISELHGKHYYINLGPDKRLADYAKDYLFASKELHDEEFECWPIDGNYIVVSVAKCGSFRGPKYMAWEKFKRDMYARRIWPICEHNGNHKKWTREMYREAIAVGKAAREERETE